MKLPTIESLRKSGWKVRVIHIKTLIQERELTVGFFGSYKPAVYGRKTIIEITTPDGIDAAGHAYCSPVDQYDRKLGNRIALGRALNNLEVEKAWRGHFKI